MNKKFTDLFINRPVLATVVSLLIFLFGLRAIFELPVRQFPKMDNTVIQVTTAYLGANANLIQGFITRPLEKAIASADGIDYLSATSNPGLSTISAYIKLNYNPDKAFTDIMSKVAETRNELPHEAQAPVIDKETGSKYAIMYIGFNSQVMSPEQITDYLTRVVQPELETVPGIAQAQILGAKTFAMRIWLEPDKMAAYGVSPTELLNALQRNNFLAATGQTHGEYVAITTDATTSLENQKQFGNLIVKRENGSLIRLKDVAKVKLGAQDYNSSVIFNGKQAVFIGIKALPTANPLTVINHVNKLIPEVKKKLPSGLHAEIVYDATKYIRSSIHEVLRTIAEATLIVVLVIFIFLGALRTVTIPVITIPLSLVGVCSLMEALGYSFNTLTLLALVLAIGLVVDDAIVVVENIYRHIEDGMTKAQAALQGAREIAMPIISMTITLAAVYAPIGFMTGLTGSLFKEFAFTLASAVIISGILALTLSPMMCSKILNPNISASRFVSYIDGRFERIKNFYFRKLHGTLEYPTVIYIFAVVVLASCAYLYLVTNKELAPQEDQSFVFVVATAPQYATINYTTKFTKQFDKIFDAVPQIQDFFMINGDPAQNNVMSGAMLKPWDQRSVKQKTIQQELQNKLNNIAGLQTFAIGLPSIPTSGSGMPVQFVVTTIGSEKMLYHYSQKLTQAAEKSGLFLFISSSLKFNRPEVHVVINRSKAANLGISMDAIANALGSLNNNYVNRFNMMGYSYQVIPQLPDSLRRNPKQIENIYVKTFSGQMVPLSTVVSLHYSTGPNSLTDFQQFHAATLSGVMMPGYTLGQGLTYLQNEANKLFPRDVGYDYAGMSRQFVQEGQALLYAFFFSIIVIYLVLAAQFESFVDPLIILISVPLSICGALIFLNLGLATINIYTQIGLITLIGLISKHGILMVEFANQLQRQEGLSKRDAIEKAASIRLRPILMTTAAMILGVTPLVFASGAGAVSRYDIGLVVATGMAIGTLFTLFVVPTMYQLLANNHTKLERS